MADWADVFAKAEVSSATGSTERETDATEDTVGLRARENVESTPRKRRPKKRSRSHQPNEPLERQRHLDTRSKFEPDSLLTTILCEGNVSLKQCFERSIDCQGWVDGAGICKSCRRASFRHRAVVVSSGWAWNLYWALRNLRCLAVINILDAAAIVEKREWKQYRIMLEQLSKRAHQERSVWSSLATSWEDLIQNLPRLSKSAYVDLIIACDACYYRLYYSDMTNLNKGGEARTGQYVPHPVVYFGEFYAELKSTYSSLLPQNLCTGSVKDRYNLDSDNGRDEREVDALTALHKIRFLETLAYFRVAGSREDQDEWMKPSVGTNSTSFDPAVHDTPAPGTLCKWRDSCRDWICHLYGYATVPPPTVDRIVQFAASSSSNSSCDSVTIIDFGSGTGYSTHFLKQRGIDMRALDVVPTSSTKQKPKTKERRQHNEYHGQTPAFSLVEKGTVDTLRQVMSRSTSKRKKFVLILAYPPPDSEMGYQAAKAFCELGGTHLIYIGEFRGLTGTPRLERYLTKHAEKAPSTAACPTWGTDCSNVTFWVLSKEAQPTTQRFLSCDNCGSEPPIRRLRILRHLSYCSKKCWHAHRHSDEFKGHLQCSGLHGQVNVDALSFENNIHFHNLK